jgi:hypothetical protein
MIPVTQSPHKLETMNMTTKTTTVAKIIRVEADHLRGIPKNGNLHTQAMAYMWQLMVNDKSMGMFDKLSQAKGAAKDYAKTVTVVR